MEGSEVPATSTEVPNDSLKSVDESATETAPPAFVMGIDFGTQRSVCAVTVDYQQVPLIAADELGHDRLTMVASFRNGEGLLGEEALASSVSVPKDSINCVKRFLGRKMTEISNEISEYPFKLNGSENGIDIEVNHNGQTLNLNPEEISAMFLSRLKKMAELKSGQTEVKDAVFAVPGSWNDAQKSALLNSAEISGIRPIQLISSNTAAAVTYWFTRFLRDIETVPKRNVIFVEMGHSNFGVQVVRFEKDTVTVLASGFEQEGSSKLDEQLYRQFVEEFKAKNGIDVNQNAKAKTRLRKEAEKTKEILSTIPETHVQVECLAEDRDFKMKISRENMEKTVFFFIRKYQENSRKSLGKFQTFNRRNRFY
eukprot:TRINITY_DN14787_c0_g1_i1.p1 TRINITY_DN14787_c0_g1~~TRINITY_DN14787_c0_g1_i1.p1  ORF type:complete len:368 (-),score=84.31 TRINITY_DN14787_c0_g1_i1:10-1113(-)